jgi:hypothetical protein
MQIMKPSTIQIVSKIKTIHSLLSQQREFSNSGLHINSDDLRTIKNISKEIQYLCIEISDIQNDRYLNETPKLENE